MRRGRLTYPPLRGLRCAAGLDYIELKMKSNMRYNVIMISIKKKLILMGCSSFFIIGLFAQKQEDLKERADSIRYIFGIRVDDSDVLELSGHEVMRFHLYTSDNSTKIVWIYQQEYYIYPIIGKNHEVRGEALFELLKKNGLNTFVAYKTQLEKKPFSKYHQVLALQIAANREGD
jgi:hypothetical protein